MDVKKYLKQSFSLLIIYTSFLSQSHASWFQDFIGWGNTRILPCRWGDCWLQEGIDLVWTGINDVETERTLSEYIQDVAAFALTFVSIIAVLYIIYAGFRILIWNGEEEQLKKSKTTIIYVIIGLVVMWLAWSITAFVLGLFRA